MSNKTDGIMQELGFDTEPADDDEPVEVHATMEHDEDEPVMWEDNPHAPTEATGVAWTEIYIKSTGSRVNVTQRSFHDSQGSLDAVAKLTVALETILTDPYFHGADGKSRYSITPVSPASRTAASAAQEQTPRPVPPTPSQLATRSATSPPDKPAVATAAPQTLGGKPIFEIHAQLMKILPQPGGKTRVEFRQVGDEWPRISITRQADKLVSMFADTEEGLTLEFFKTADEVSVNYSIKYVESDRLSTSGNPFKDVVSITQHGA
jgi:hypothetical protein